MAVPAPVYEAFAAQTFRGETDALIQKAHGLIESYRRQGYVLSLRQLYYQFVSRDWLANTERNYKLLGKVVTNARMNGLISWTGIEDRGRSMQSWLIEEDVGSILSGLPNRYAQDMWARQEFYVEVWVEKDALSNVVERACGKRRVPYLACKGYLSASEAWRSGKRMQAARERGQTPHIIHLGDHDPSGIDMSRDNLDRITMFSEGNIGFDRIALNRDQVDRYNPPPNPTKLTDSRAEDYVEAHGYECWELDALEPSVVVNLIDEAIEVLVDEAIWEEDLEVERDQKALLAGVAENWREIENLIRYNRGEADEGHDGEEEEE